MDSATQIKRNVERQLTEFLEEKNFSIPHPETGEKLLFKFKDGIAEIHIPPCDGEDAFSICLQVELNFA